MVAMARFDPTAKQSEVETQDTPSKYCATGGVDCVVQVAPPSLVVKTIGDGIMPLDVDPTATQDRADGHEIPARDPIPDGSVSLDHVLPLSTVART